MSKKNKAQLPIFTAGQELPIFTQSAYGTVHAPFVEREEAKQVAMFPVTFDELAQAEQKKKAKRAERQLLKESRQRWIK